MPAENVEWKQDSEVCRNDSNSSAAAAEAQITIRSDRARYPFGYEVVEFTAAAFILPAAAIVSGWQLSHCIECGCSEKPEKRIALRSAATQVHPNGWLVLVVTVWGSREKARSQNA
jgi:hypothetical protein